MAIMRELALLCLSFLSCFFESNLRGEIRFLLAKVVDLSMPTDVDNTRLSYFVGGFGLITTITAQINLFLIRRPINLSDVEV